MELDGLGGSTEIKFIMRLAAFSRTYQKLSGLDNKVCVSVLNTWGAMLGCGSRQRNYAHCKPTKNTPNLLMNN